MTEIQIDVSNDAFIVRTVICEHVEIIRSEMTRPSVLFRPVLSREGNVWRALLGDNVQEGLAAFGATPEKAMAMFDILFRQDPTDVA